MYDGTPKSRWLLDLLETHEASLLRYAARLTGGDVEKARDLVQETFLKLWKAGPEETAGHTAPWLFKVCRNLAFDHLRKEQRMHAWSDERHGAKLAVAPEEGGEGPQTDVLAALGELPANQQEVIRLKFQEGLSYKDIAAVTGHSVSHVGVLIHAGIKTLRARFAAAPAAGKAKGGAQ